MGYDVIILGETREGVATARREAARTDRVALVATGASASPFDSDADFEEFLALPAVVSLRFGHVTEDAWRAVAAEWFQHVAAARANNLLSLCARGVDWFTGAARFADPHAITVQTVWGRLDLTAERYVIATGTQPGRLGWMSSAVASPVDMLTRPLPASAVIVGAGATGRRVAEWLSLLAVPTMLVDGSAEAVRLRDAVPSNVRREFGEDVIGLEAGRRGSLQVVLESGRRLAARGVIHAVSRIGATAGLNLAAAGVGLDERERVWCNRGGVAWTPHISAVGSVRSALTAADRTVTPRAQSNRTPLGPRPRPRAAAVR